MVRLHVAAILLLFLPNIAISTYLDCPCKVVKVADGDTVHVLDQTKKQHKIRLGGIGAPERKQAFVSSANEQHNTSNIDRQNLIYTLVLPSIPSTTFIEPSKGMFLIAGQDLSDPNFANSVVLLVDVDANGALGLIINRVTEYKLAEAISEIQDDPTTADLLYLGGPVGADTVTLLMRSKAASEDIHHVFNDVYFSTSIPVLKAALNKSDHEQRLRVYAGHAGWGAGQLQYELRRGDWHLVEADAELLFNAEPEHIWLRLIRSVSGLLVQNINSQSIGP